MIDHVNSTHTMMVATQAATGPRRSQTSEAPAASESGAQYDFAAIFGAASDERNPATPTAAGQTANLTSSIATATTTLKLPVEEPASNAINMESAVPYRTPVTKTTATTTTTTSTPAASTTTPANAATSTPVSNATAPAAVTTPGIEALVTAMMSGNFQATYVNDPSKLQETTPIGTDTMPSFYYASDQTAAQMAQLLGGTVVQMPAFGQDKGWSEPMANFIQLPNGQTFNAADVAYYAHSGAGNPAQLTADITQTINEGSAWTNYYKNGGPMPTFAVGYVGPAISGMTYPSGMIGTDGNVINPAMQNTAT